MNGSGDAAHTAGAATRESWPKPDYDRMRRLRDSTGEQAAADLLPPPRQAEIVDIALWRAARQLVRRSGSAAPSRARALAAAASFDGDADGARIWHGIAVISDVLVAGHRTL